jgi:hypothetical protein
MSLDALQGIGDTGAEFLEGGGRAAFDAWVAKGSTGRWTWNCPLEPIELLHIASILEVARSGMMASITSVSDMRFAIDALVADVMLRIGGPVDAVMGLHRG